MWKIDSDGNASNELGEKIWLANEHGRFKIYEKRLVETKKWRGFMTKFAYSFHKKFSEADAREQLFRHVDFLNLDAELGHLAIKEIYRELDARAKARKKLKMLSLWAQ